MSPRLISTATAIVLAVGSCGDAPTTDGRVRSIEAELVCVATDREDLCFDIDEVDGALGLAVDDCVTVRRKLESGRPFEVEQRAC